MSDPQQLEALQIEVEIIMRNALDMEQSRNYNRDGRQQAEAQRDAMQADLDWIRKKIGVEPGTPMFTGDGDTIAGRLHVWGHRQHCYVTSVQEFKAKEAEQDALQIEVERLKAERRELLKQLFVKEADITRLRKGSEADNHHNALACPYCNPQKLILMPPEQRDAPNASTPEGGDQE